MIPHERLSAFLLQLYQTAAHCPLENFQSRTLSMLAEVLPFDSAWWVTRDHDNGGHTVHNSCVHRLPAEFPLLCLEAEREDVVLQECLPTPWQSRSFATDALVRTPASRRIQHLTGIRHVLATSVLEADGASVGTCISLYRHDDRPYSGEDRQLKQWLTPHLLNAVQINRQQQLSQLRSALPGTRHPAALVDGDAFVYAMEPEFRDSLRREWPTWTAGALPAALCEMIRDREQGYEGRHISAHCASVAHLLLIALTPANEAHSELLRLSSKERSVAELFARGYSYKEVARMLGIAPATMRHHLRAVYRKLEVSDKVALVGRFAGQPPARPKEHS